MSKSRLSNPVTGDDVVLQLFTYNSNNRVDFSEVVKVEIYYLDPAEITESNLEGKRLVETVTTIDHVETGLYQITVPLLLTKYVIGNYIDVWYVTIEPEEEQTTVINNWQIYPSLFMTSPLPLVYDFDFTFRPNKIRKGSKKYLIVEIEPNVPDATDLQRYYENIAIVNPVSITIKQKCGECIPPEEDLRIVVDNEPINLREKNRAYYLLDTEDMEEGIYDVFFTMSFGESIYISDSLQLQIYT